MYLPYISKKLAQAHIPDDFKYLAIAESALRNVSYSNVGAAGIWQFMPDTARRYGLRVDDEVDERLDFPKATDAAIRYIQALYDDLQDRTLVAAAYNRGENGLKRDMARQDVDNYYDLWLNNETARYVFRILAIKEVLEHKNTYFNQNILGSQYRLPKTQIIKIRKIDDIAKWAHKQGYSYAEIRQLNPWIQGNSLSEGKREIKVFKR
ncbi:MAG: lytic transglycosylase domain-containing protein [bacterium]|nr:lytic transglycosylase domain-containing protein [bacterium]